MTESNGGVAMVTGAGGGIGGAVAAALARQGWVVAAVDSAADRLTELTEKLAADGLTVAGYRADVAVSAEVDRAVARIEDELGPVGLLVNAAGVLRLGAATELSDEDWRAVLSVNLDGVFHCSRAVAARMRRHGRGAIVTVASNAARVPRTRMAAYGAAKAAAVSYTKTLGLELAGHGIRCNVVSPGSTDTDMLRQLCAGEDGRRAAIEGSPETYKVGIPLRRIAEPADIADAVLFLASDRARHVTMQDLCVDGGAALGA
ncbi:2,3-dihydro-2,3-dihydroxybenzoate dehydrogenase [Amycolatopsis arida]|uniref:2,3-dihydro-2,3-dihydroxybenzoate dehydrogenase n=1 Tax=Amycolatopsis arida TaxID=587909 RepID=A0A1I5V668_9PSEU|nr:2,3-dihydro-2,3-dihydroxybenzoate dehydrogenase [Amycolatopsis arida]TDX91162.1 2,3-dihydro-2,3-dihydroxybenzoate dehydrogenase [Amycolatopsis arida]SFQ02882.1 2,3-dihydro-2,3-dihydroxybenzoate dehydrogenase [Amycolatopsis arida]